MYAGSHQLENVAHMKLFAIDSRRPHDVSVSPVQKKTQNFQIFRISALAGRRLPEAF